MKIVLLLMKYSSILVPILLVVLIYSYNKLVKLRSKVREALSGVDVQLARRYELIPDLLDLLDEGREHEAGLLESLKEMNEKRTETLVWETLPQQANEARDFGRRLKEIIRVLGKNKGAGEAERFKLIGSTLKDIEDHLQLARRYYNAVVRDYNIARESLPTGLFAALLGFERAEYFGTND